MTSKSNTPTKQHALHHRKNKLSSDANYTIKNSIYYAYPMQTQKTNENRKTTNTVERDNFNCLSSILSKTIEMNKKKSINSIAQIGPYQKIKRKSKFQEAVEKSNQNKVCFPYFNSLLNNILVGIKSKAYAFNPDQELFTIVNSPLIESSVLRKGTTIDKKHAAHTAEASFIDAQNNKSIFSRLEDKNYKYSDSTSCKNIHAKGHTIASKEIKINEKNSELVTFTTESFKPPETRVWLGDVNGSMMNVNLHRHVKNRTHFDINRSMISSDSYSVKHLLVPDRNRK